MLELCRGSIYRICTHSIHQTTTTIVSRTLTHAHNNVLPLHQRDVKDSTTCMYMYMYQTVPSSIALKLSSSSPTLVTTRYLFSSSGETYKSTEWGINWIQTSTGVCIIIITSITLLFHAHKARLCRYANNSKRLWSNMLHVHMCTIIHTHTHTYAVCA